MFKLIRNTDHAFEEAAKFISGSTLDPNMPGKVAARSFPAEFPSLVDWFANRDYTGNEVLDSHVCDKNIAKCLIYPKTNKLKYITWHIVRGIGEIPSVVSHSLFFDKDTKIIKADGFNEIAAELEQGELLLMGVKSITIKRGRPNTGAHVSIVNRALAKELVYYEKDKRKIQAWSPKFVGQGDYILYV